MKHSTHSLVKQRIIRNPLLRKLVAQLSGHKCAFPGCTQDLLIDDLFIGEIASIEALAAGGPRYNETADANILVSPENYLLLCPNHHRIVDRQPNVYTAPWLKKARADHLKTIQAALNGGEEKRTFTLPSSVELSLSDALQVWRESQENCSEEFWQELFERCPAVISQLFPRAMIKLGSKCFVGGKSLHNSGGNLVDFVYANPSTNNVVLIEIKTPGTKLIGKKYRQNSYSISDELSGSVVQVLNYRDSLIKEYFALSKGEEVIPFNAFSPKCVVVAGHVERELTTPCKRKSFELFRSELSGTEVVGYDELFEKVLCVLEVAK